MKKSVLFIALMAVTMTAGAQRNDLYSTGKSTGKSSGSSASQTAVVTRTPSYTDPAPVQQAAPVVTTTPQIIVDRDPDEYNRRYTYGTSQIQYEDGSILDDVPTVYIHDTVYVRDDDRNTRPTTIEGEERTARGAKNRTGNNRRNR